MAVYDRIEPECSRLQEEKRKIAREKYKKKYHAEYKAQLSCIFYDIGILKSLLFLLKLIVDHMLSHDRTHIPETLDECNHRQIIRAHTPMEACK